MKRIIFFLTLSILCSCHRTTPWIDNSVDHRVSLSVDSWEGWEGTKSSIEPAGTDAIHSVNVLVYKLDGGQYVYDPDKSLHVAAGKEMNLLLDRRFAYKLHCIANAPGDLRRSAAAYARLEDAEENLRVMYGGNLDPFRETGLPMAGYADVPAGSTGDIDIRFTRLYSRWRVSLDCSELQYSSLRVNSMVVCNAPLGVYPISAASRITSPDETTGETGGDRASAQDLEKLERGESIFLYILENVQGALSNGGKGPSDRIPDAIRDAGFTEEVDYGMLTYVKMNASVYTPTADYDNVEYKAFLGENHTDDFSIRRNTTRNLILKFISDKVVESTWKITPDEPVKVYKPTIHVNMSTYTSQLGAWVPEIGIQTEDCEKLSEIAGDFLEGVGVTLTGRSYHSGRVDYRDEQVWRNRHREFLNSGGKLLGTATFHPEAYLNGALRDAYYSRGCGIHLEGYSKQCEKYDSRNGNEIVFHPCNSEKKLSRDSFHTLINPANYPPFTIESEFFDGDDLYSAPWLWSYSPVEYDGNDNMVRATLEISIPKEVTLLAESIYGLNISQLFSLSEDYSNGCPMTEKKLQMLGWDRSLTLMIVEY